VNFIFIHSRTFTAIAMIVMALTLFASSFTVNLILAETGKGEDIFKVILTVFGADKSKEDVVAIVTTSNGEASKVKLLDSAAPYVVPLNSSIADSGHLTEYIATFPNVTVNAGTEYKACILTTKDLNLICNTGQNSPASRPEFVDISLNATSNTPSDETISEESEGVEREGEGD
jgi:hypothetical protein